MENEIISNKKKWFIKNKKWVVLSGCISIILIIGLFVGLLFLGINYVMKNSDVYKESFKKTEENKSVIQKIGQKIEQDGMITGSIETSGSLGKADLEIPIKGSKETGVLYVIAEKHGDKWIYNEMYVTLNKSNEQINLLDKSQ